MNQHFLDIPQLSRAKIENLTLRAKQFKEGAPFPTYPTQHLATLFYENSTRTRVSFELAAKNLSIPVTHLDLASSSQAKGESVLDTLKTLVAMGIDLFVIRHKEEGLPQYLAENLGQEAHLINAGDGTNAHPSQAMLDLMTILEHKPDVSKLKIAIVGNIRHSRVANSLQQVFSRVGVGELLLVAPSLWWPEEVIFGKVTESLEEGLDDADVIICLRIQYERLLEAEHFDLKSYRKAYALTKERLRLLKPGAMVLHPGPINRGIEIDSEVADGPQSFILEQVKNGVFMRMAILESLLN